jgi:hypothetical protein
MQTIQPVGVHSLPLLLLLHWCGGVLFDGSALCVLLGLGFA